MSDKLETSLNRLTQEARNAESCLAKIQQHLASAQSMPLGDLPGALKEATAQCEATREQAQQVSQRLNAALEKKRQSSATTFDDADLSGEVLRHEDEADREETLAADALLVATQALRQAEVVILSALKTRRTALDLARFRDTF